MKVAILAGLLFCQNMANWWPEDFVPRDINERIGVCEEIVEKSEIYNIDPLMALTFAYQESKFNRNAVSSHGAIGPLQYMPNVWQCVRDENDQCDHVLTGLKIMRYYFDNSVRATNGSISFSNRNIIESIEAQACMNPDADWNIHNAITGYVCGSCDPGPSRYSRTRMQRYNDFHEVFSQEYLDKAQYMMYYANNVLAYIHSRTPFSAPT
jgi:hypothetical protein